MLCSRREARKCNEPAGYENAAQPRNEAGGPHGDALLAVGPYEYTSCSTCHIPLIERDGYTIPKNALEDAI